MIIFVESVCIFDFYNFNTNRSNRMKIYKFSRVLSAPFALIFIWFMYKIFSDYNFPYIAWAIIPGAILILLYLFQPQIDYWWLSKNPIEIDKSILDLLSKTNPRYSSLSSIRKEEFNRRLLLYTEGRSFISKGSERDYEVPYDIKNMIAQVPVTMTLNEKDFLLKAFDHIVLYKHAFPSPTFQFLHTAETQLEDGVIIMSLEHIELGMLQPDRYYNIAYHAYAEAFVKNFPRKNYPLAEDELWPKIEATTGFTKEKILSILGFESIDLLHVLITLYFTHRNGMKRTMPEKHMRLEQIFS